MCVHVRNVCVYVFVCALGTCVLSAGDLSAATRTLLPRPFNCHTHRGVSGIHHKTCMRASSFIQRARKHALGFVCGCFSCFQVCN